MTSHIISRKYDDGIGVEVIFTDCNKIIGKACTVEYDGKPNIFLHSFEVKKQYRRKGYGSQILNYMIKNFGVKILYVDKDNEAIKLYKRFGFEVTGVFDKHKLIMQRRR